MYPHKPNLQIGQAPNIQNREVNIYDIESFKGLSGSLDTNLLTESGRNQIKENILKSGMIVDTIQQIVTNDTVGIQDFFSNTEQSNTTYEAVKKEIAQDPQLAQALENPELTPQQKQTMLNSVAIAVMKELGGCPRTRAVTKITGML